jgi:hypothetical protein
MRMVGRWRFFLPAFQVLLALGLATLGALQRSRRSDFISWDNTPVADVISHSINFPAALIASLLSNKRDLSLEQGVSTFLAYLFCIFLAWMAVGFALDRQALNRFERGGTKLLLVNCLGIVFGLFLCLAALALLRSPYGVIFPAAGLVWGIWISGFFVRRQIQKIQAP